MSAKKKAGKKQKKIFRPRLWPTVITVFMLAVLLGLGCWQIERLHWKENLIATIGARLMEPAEPIESLSPDTADFHPAFAWGVFQNSQSLYMFALSRAGEGGYHVLTPLRMKGGKYLLVDRGWIPYRLKNNCSRPQGYVRISGIARIPRHHKFGPPNNAAKGEWYEIDLDAMKQAAGVTQFLPYALEEDAGPDPTAYPVGGQTRIDLPNNHLGYALTWFALALALAVIYAVSSLKRPKG